MASNSRPRTGALLRDSSLTVTRRVISALLLRELLTRYGRNNIGFLWLFVEPMLFVIVITMIWTVMKKIHASDIPIVAFALTGYSSLLLWRGMPGRCMGAMQSNKSLLYHQQVTILDVYIARILLEFMAVSTSFVVLAIAFYAMDWIRAPEDALQVLGGWLLLGWFGAGLGMTIGGLAEKSVVIRNLWGPFHILLTPFSGVAYIADALPAKMREVVLYLPMLNALEYVREGWFGSLIRAHYDIPYVIVFNLLLTFVGLSLVKQIGLDTREE